MSKTHIGKANGRRTLKRSTKNIDVEVYCHGFPRAQGKSRNIGSDGLFVEIGPMRISRNTTLEVEFEIRNGGANGKRFRLPVFRGRRADDVSPEGMEFIFLNHNMEVLMLFKEALENTMAAEPPVQIGAIDSDTVTRYKNAS